MRPRTLILVFVAVFAALAVLAFGLNRGEGPATSDIDLAEAMRADTTGYALALAPQPFVFPGDHGPHPDFRTEWWYFTGNLQAEDGREFGYQLTFFRNALAPLAAVDFVAVDLVARDEAVDFRVDVPDCAVPWSSAPASSTDTVAWVSVFLEEVVTHYLSYGRPCGPLTVNTTMTLSSPRRWDPDWPEPQVPGPDPRAEAGS